ncbi:MAG TPA: response regulator [Caldisericia bacterium]|nr:response regulator [Caldisericia bacterium]HPF48479.1 response regulator [Caldisericia bacterium]HPI83341.1 response regulator [Caldisericia bacterium]HPQ92933.1 response regulator [Caldisericia bacterium]HRV73969.1 response regulator [Caldisericia bacterium]
MSENQEQKRVLVVEDELAIAKLIKYVLENADFEVTLVTEGASALKEIDRETPDIMILDLMLPTFSGFDVMKSLNESDRIGTFPIVVLTCRGQEEDKERALNLGASEFMTKPFSPSGLVAVLRSLINHSGGIHE